MRAGCARFRIAGIFHPDGEEKGATMTALCANRAARRRAGAVAGVALMLAAPGPILAQRPPITIPPAAQIAPPAPFAAPPSAPAGLQPAPRSLLPTSIQTLRDPQGAGIAIYGQLTGPADSALAVLAALFAYSAAFDPSPTSRLVLADQSDHAVQALFTATVHSVPVIGVAAIALSDTGGDIAVFYDYPDSFAGSFPRLRQALGPGGDGAIATLAQLHLGDGSAIGVAPGWRVISQGEGSVDLAGPQGEFLSLGDTIPVYAGATSLAGYAAQGPCCDPVAALRAVFPQLAASAQRRGLPPQQLTGIVDSAASPAPTGGQGAFILATVSVGGRVYGYLALADAIGGFTDPWTFRLSAIMAPQPVFAAELPTLLRIWGSYSANPPGFIQQLQDAAQGIDALQPMLQHAPPPHATAGFNASGGWDQITPLVATSMGASDIDAAAAESLTAGLASDTGRPWHLVPADSLK
jgi:hypothetical protein